MSQSRFVRYADAHSGDVTSVIMDLITAPADDSDATSQEFISREDIEAVDTFISISIEQALKIGYFLGMLDGRRDALGVQGERFVNGESVWRGIADVIYINENAGNACPADVYIKKQLGELANMPHGMSFAELEEIESEVR